jgi:hypothetical protein
MSRRHSIFLAASLALLFALASSPRAHAGRKTTRTTSRTTRAKGKGKGVFASPFRASAKAPKKGALMTSTHGSHLAQGEYTQIRDASLALLRKFKPGKHYYISLGRSPAPIVAFLENLSPDMAMTLPASGVRQALPVQHKAAYYAYFDKLIPKSVLESGQTLVLFDRAGVYSGRYAGGNSIAKVRDVLKEYLKERGYKNKIKGVAYTLKIPFQQDLGLTAITTEKFPFVDSWGSSLHGTEGRKVDDIAPYPENHIARQPVSKLKANKPYATFRKHLMARMRADSSLDKTLRKHLADLLTN